MSWVAVAIGGSTIISGVMASQAAGDASAAQLKGAKDATAAELEMFYQGRADMAPWREGGAWALGYQQDPVKTGPMLSYYDWMKQEGRSGFSPSQKQQGALTRDEFDRLGEGATKTSTTGPNRYAYQAYVDDWKQKQGTFTPSDTFREGSLLDKLQKGPGDYTKSPGYDFRLGEGVKTMERGAAARGNVLSGAQTKALTQYGQDYATGDYDNFLRRYYDSLKPLQSIAGVGQTTAAQGAQMGTQVGGSVGQNYLAAGQARASGYINQANVATGAVKSGVENYLAWDYRNRQNPAGGAPPAYNPNYLNQYGY